jgi:hypothetical protein
MLALEVASTIAPAASAATNTTTPTAIGTQGLGGRRRERSRS